MGPEALISILVGSTVVDQVKHLYLNNGDPSEEEVLEYSRALVSTVCMLVGILATALGLARFGFMDSILAEPALRGFITGAACVIIIDQLMPLLGLKVPPGDADELLHASPITRIRYLLDHLDGISRVALAIGVGSLVFLVAMRFVKRRWRRVGAIRNIPEILVTVVAATIVSWFVRLDTRGVVVLGSVDATFPMPRLPRLPSEVNPRDVLSTAITITVIGVTESLIVAREYASRNHYSVSSNRELVAIGMSNFVGAFFGAYPAFGSLTRSKLNDRSGGRSQLSGLVIFAFVLTSLLWLLPLLQYLPKPVLCAIIVNTALSLLTRTPREVRFLANIRAWDDLLLLFVIFAVTVLGSVDMGLLLAVAISVVVVIKRSNMPKITLLGRPTTAANPSAATTFTATQGIPRASDLSMVPTTLSGSSGRQHVTFRPIQQLSSPRARPGHPRQPATPNAVYSGVTSHNEPGFGYSDDEFVDDEGEDEDERVELVEGVLIIRIEEPLYFANTNQLQARLRRLELYGDMRVHPSESARLAPVQAVIFDVASMPSLDGSAMSTLSNIVTQYHLRNVIVGFVDTVPAVMEMFKLSGLYDRVGSDMFFDSIQHALEYLESLAVVPQPVAMVGVVTQDSHLDYFSDAGF
ncbi:hypothetical protein EV182_002275 [Spiromyces aspiralis]|uniref:Uncharacterized protein n=1 Tax=Spiromyces aspiralis TaxID=68401 RepID=A0ACC1HW55_9FUNG|nr:hypothetical protein EV182_002275 [Spiromyces aspiralis]